MVLTSLPVPGSVRRQALLRSWPVLLLVLVSALPLTGCGVRFITAGAQWPDAGAPDASTGSGLSVDPSFASEGTFLLDVGGIDNLGFAPQALDVQPDGRIVFGGIGGSATDSDFVAVRLTEAGQLDPTFGGGAGMAVVDLGTPQDTLEFVRLRANGNILLAGSSGASVASQAPSAVQLKPDGTRDLAFGSGGQRIMQTGYAFSIINGGLVLADGRLRFGGQGRKTDSSPWDLLVLGLASDGADDPSFLGASGLVAIDFFGSDEFGGSVVGTPGSRMLVSGSTFSTVTGGFDFALARVGEDGAPDPAFGTGAPLGRVSTDFAGATDRCAVVAQQPDGKVLCAGLSTDAAGKEDFALARYLPDGSLDLSFGSPARNGKAVIDMGGVIEVMRSLVVLPDGRIVCGGTSQTPRGDTDLALCVLSADGLPDPRVGVAGKVFIDVKGGQDDTLHGLALDGQGRILGLADTRGASSDFVVIRLIP
jgi:uncharacterized delta-60 repeat protein